MKLTVRNDLGQEFEYFCDQFFGCEVFEEAREQWGYDWETYIVLNGTTVLERVINPMSIEFKLERIH